MEVSTFTKQQPGMERSGMTGLKRRFILPFRKADWNALTFSQFDPVIPQHYVPLHSRLLFL